MEKLEFTEAALKEQLDRAEAAAILANSTEPRALDVDLTVPSLLRGIYGTKTWMEQLHQQQIFA